ncbi:MAG: hypothetical protein QM296_12580, partial [Bacillota bacterium]|nr:hypothetical protein [Bacillota bacterium]
MQLFTIPGQVFLILPNPWGNIGFFAHRLYKYFDIARSRGQYRLFCPPPGQKLRYCPFLGAISAFMSTPWSKTSILPDPGGNTAIFVHPLVKNFDISRYRGQYRDFCPRHVQKQRYLQMRGAISGFL